MNTPEPHNNPPPPAPAKAAYTHWTVLSRVVVAGLLLASAGLLWWSYYRVFLPPFKQSRETNTTVVKLAAEVDDLDRAWSPTNVARIDQEFALAQPRLFADRPELEAWLADFRDQMAPLGLDFKTELTDTNAPATNGVAGARFTVVPATITIDFPPLPEGAPGPAASPSQRLLQLLQRLTGADKNAVLTGLTAAGGTNSIAHAVVGVSFWVNTRKDK